MSSTPVAASGTAVVWSRVWNDVDNPAWLAARDLLDLSSTVSRFFACYLEAEESGPWLGWAKAAEDIADAGFSSTERRLAQLVASLTTGAPVDIRVLGSMGSMGSWRDDVWQVMTWWVTDDRLHLVDADGDRL